MSSALPNLDVMKSCMESHLPHEIEIANSFTRVAIEFAIAFAGHVSNFHGGRFVFIIDEANGLTNLVSSSMRSDWCSKADGALPVNGGGHLRR